VERGGNRQQHLLQAPGGRSMWSNKVEQAYPPLGWPNYYSLMQFQPQEDEQWWDQITLLKSLTFLNWKDASLLIVTTPFPIFPSKSYQCIAFFLSSPLCLYWPTLMAGVDHEQGLRPIITFSFFFFWVELGICLSILWFKLGPLFSLVS
jgi:hypothetical protein